MSHHLEVGQIRAPLGGGPDGDPNPISPPSVASMCDPPTRSNWRNHRREFTISFFLPISVTKTDQKNFTLRNRIRHREMAKAEKQAQGNEARTIWNRLEMQTPSDPFGPTGEFSGESIRLAGRGGRYLYLADRTDSSTARATTMQGMYRARKRPRDSSYMRRLGDYVEAYAKYIGGVLYYVFNIYRIARLLCSSLISEWRKLRRRGETFLAESRFRPRYLVSVVN